MKKIIIIFFLSLTLQYCGTLGYNYMPSQILQSVRAEVRNMSYYYHPRFLQRRALEISKRRNRDRLRNKIYTKRTSRDYEQPNIYQHKHTDFCRHFN
ncbi:MAG: hypothetical protein ACI870_000575 [Crocinitomicaceae bacterium]|jgi:hypothetical protein